MPRRREWSREDSADSEGAASLTGAGTYESVLLRELPKRHHVGIYHSEADLRQQWDVAHCTDLKHLPYDLPRQLKCPLVVNVHDYYWVNFYLFLCLDLPLRFLFQKFRRLKYGRMFRHVYGVILHSRFMCEIVPHPRKYFLFHFGLDYVQSPPVPWAERENLILFVGGDYFRKGLPRLLRALPAVLEQVPDARLLVVGKDYGYARALARFLSRGLPVEIVNGLPRAEVDRLYARAKVLVLPSEIEALSLVSAECTMAGVPPILADVGGMPEVVRHGESGFLFALQDHALLAGQIVQLLTDQALSERFVHNGQAFFAGLTIDRMMAQLDDIYADAALGAASAQTRSSDR